MIRIGIIAEDDNDAKAISTLLNKNFPEQFYFQRLLPNRNGSQLDDNNDNHLAIALRREFEFEELDYLLYIRDLDALISDKEQLNFRKKRFRRFSRVVDRKAIFMLNIYEIEALILADFDTYKNYKNRPDLVFENVNAALTEKPDLALPDYNKGELTKIIPLLNLEIVKSNHRHFSIFMTEFFKMIEQKKYSDAPYYE